MVTSPSAPLGIHVATHCKGGKARAQKLLEKGNACKIQTESYPAVKSKVSPLAAQSTSARCPCRPGHMPMSFWRHAYVTLARCLCHHLRHAYVAEVRCLCRQSDIGIPPAPHQKRPVYRCSGRPFFVVFGHFRHEMRIFPASEACFGAAGGGKWSETVLLYIFGAVRDFSDMGLLWADDSVFLHFVLTDERCSSYIF